MWAATRPAAILPEFIQIAAGSSSPFIGSPHDVSAPSFNSPSQTRLYLMLAAGEGAEARLRSALSAAPFDAVMISPPAGSQRATAPLEALVALAQSNNAAALIAGDPALARATRADGVHLSWSDDLEDRYDAARKSLGPREIVGVDASGSRHVAMTLAEAGADYIAFTKSEPAAEDETAIDGQHVLVQWWAEVFEVPCVALGVRTAEQATALASSGADYVGIEAEAGLSLEAMASRARAVAAAVGVTDPEGNTGAGLSSSRGER